MVKLAAAHRVAVKYEPLQLQHHQRGQPFEPGVFLGRARTAAATTPGISALHPLAANKVVKCLPQRGKKDAEGTRVESKAIPARGRVQYKYIHK